MFQLIRTFITVYETKNFTQAADILFLSQPTVSAQIKKLEEQLQTVLFIRKAKQVIHPTSEAVFLYPRFLTILEEWEDSVARVSKKELFREKCVIACSHTCSVHFVPKFTPALLAHFPTIDFSFLTMNSATVVEQLEQNKIDIGFIENSELTSPQLTRTAIYEDQLVLAGSPEADYWLLREQSSGLRYYNERYLKEHNLTPPIIQVNNNEVILALLEEGIGRSVISKMSVTSQINWMPLPEESTRKLYLVSHKERFRKEIDAICQYIEEQLFN
ncbi:LysR substrate-binding domain-containing protein [Enterococcus sp. LJL128]